MEERDLEAEKALSRFLVDQLHAFAGELVDRGAHIRNLVCDVVHTGPALREELADGGLFAERGEQLDPALADPHRRRFDALVGDGLAGLDPGAEDPLVRRHRLVEILDGHPEMVDRARFHRGRCYRPAWWSGRIASVRTGAVLAAIGIAAFATACGGSKTYGAGTVNTAFRRQGIELTRNREMERRFREAVGDGRGMLRSMLGAKVPIPERFFVAPKLPEELDFYVALFQNPTKPRDIVGDAKQLETIHRQGLAVLNRANVIVVADKSLEQRTRAALKSLG